MTEFTMTLTKVTKSVNFRVLVIECIFNRGKIHEKHHPLNGI